PLPKRPRSRSGGEALERTAAAVVRELAGAEQGRFALRADARWRREHEARELPAAGRGLPARLRERGTYLVTGGLGGVGSLVAEWLARTCKANLVLVGRRALPPREQWDAHLTTAGAE